MQKKKSIFIRRFFAILMTTVLLCLQLIPVGAVTAEDQQEKDSMTSLYMALELAYGMTGDLLCSYGGPETYPFSGTVNANNIDRIIGTAFTLDYAIYSEKYEQYVDVESDVLSLPGDVVKSAVTTWFNVTTVDLSLSKFYNKETDTYVSAGEEEVYFPCCLLAEQLSFSYKSSADGMYTLDGIYIGTNRFATGRLVFKIMLSDTGFKVYSVELTPTELLSPKDTSSLEIENYTHFLKGVKANTKVKALPDMFNTTENGMKIYSYYYEEINEDAFLGTGTTVILLDALGDIADYLELVVLGDVNGDGTLSSADYLQIKKTFAAEMSLEGCFLEAADTNQDGVLGTVDYMRLKKHLAREFDIYA